LPEVKPGFERFIENSGCAEQKQFI